MSKKENYWIMHKKIYVIIVVVLMGLCSCNKDWELHYMSPGESIDMSMWDAISAKEEYSDFVGYMEEFGLDSIFETGSSYTLFIPDNEAFAKFNTDTGDMYITLSYHILDYVFNASNVTESKPIRTITGKFAHLEESSGAYKFSGKLVTSSSPLYKDGRYYAIDGVAFPLANLWEYISENTTVLMDYILRYDSVILDRDKSTPLGFDDFGNIIYDSVYTLVNYFDSLYYPLNREDRNKTASFILFTDQQYDLAMENMAANLGEGIQSGDDIPKVWKDEVLLPELIETGLFPNTLELDDLAAGRLKNVRGDSVDIDFTNIDQDSRILASNGVIFSYLDFQVPEYLYRGEVRIEGEHMVEEVSSGIYHWKPEYPIEGGVDVLSLNPVINTSDGAENDSLVSLTFLEQPFEEHFAIEMTFKNLFPQKYLFVMGANYRPSGFWEVFANGELIRQFDTFKLRQSVASVAGGYYFAINGNNRFDAYVENMTEYGDITIRLVYTGPGGTSTINPTNGLSIDFVSLTPTE